jgi:hypothetical protein
MMAKKKKFLMLRGKLSGSLIVVSREWYESKRLKRSVWRIAAQHDDKETLMAMGRMTDMLKAVKVEHTTEGLTNVS